MDRRSFLMNGTAALTASALRFPAHAAASKKQNFIIFYADDLGYGDLSCYGAEDIQTPHIDELAARGTRFTQWYSNSPVCSPSRVSLMTGCYPQTVGVDGNLGGRGDDKGLDPNVTILPQSMKELGYRTAIFGKWHMGGAGPRVPTRRGFDEFFGHLGGCIDNYSHLFIWNVSVPWHDLWRNETEVWENGSFFPKLVVREVKRFLRENHDGPFFLYVPFNIPHYPMHAPSEYFDRFSHLPPERRHQAVMVSALDDCIGEIMAEVDRLKLRENTTIFFQSDNGPSMEQRNFMSKEQKALYEGGSPGGFRGHKFSLFEGGVRLPCIISQPGVVPEGAVNDNIGVTMDVYPTFMQLAGGKAPDRIDGLDAWPMIAHGSPSPHEHVYWRLGKQRAIRKGDWKLVLNGVDNRSENTPKEFLANLKNDPAEMTNRLDEKPDLAAALKKELDAWNDQLKL